MGWRGILGFEYGIVQAPLGPDISGPELVAAVANAGAIGILRAPDWECPDYLRELIRKTRSLTDKPFGVGIVLAFPHKENLKIILEEKVAILQLYWGEVTQDIVLEAHEAGVKVVPQIGSFEEAKRAADVGVDAIIVQGHEAGGHVIGHEAIIALVPRVVDLVASRGIPVIAAGGIVDERGYVAALALGAQGVCLGTRFLATEESFAHPIYKRKLVEMNETEYTDVFGRARWPGAPQRVLKTPFFMEWRNLPSHENEANQPVIGHTTIHGMEKEIRQFAGTVPNKTARGDIERAAIREGENDGMGVSLKDLSKKLEDFAKARDWEKYHTPRNLLLAMVGEVGELSEIFQWKGEVEKGLESWEESEKEHLGEELSDVLLYLIRLADICGIDLGHAALNKILKNAIKYPPISL